MPSRRLLVFLVFVAGCIPLPDYGDEGEPCFKNGTCKDGLECINGICTTDSCTPQCENKCSPSPDGCGGECPGPCPTEYYCDAGACLKCDTDEHCGMQCQDCTTDGGICYQEVCCYADCAGRNCGTDGCGGDCGSCMPGESCDDDGQCVPNAPPRIEWDDISGTQLSAGTHQAAFAVRFSEAVTGVGSGGVTLQGAATLSGFTTQDGVTWTFEAVGLYNGASYTISFNGNIRDDLGASLEPVDRMFSVAAGTVLYVTEDGNGSGDTPGDPTNLINAIVTAQPGTDILVAQGTYSTFIEIVPEVGLFCGFSSNFQTRNPVNLQTIIEQGTLYATATFIGAEGNIRRIIDGCVISSFYGNEPAIAVDIGVDADPVVSQCQIYTADAPKSYGIRARGSGALILNNVVLSGASAETTEYTGILLGSSGDPQVFGNWIDAGAGAGSATCISVEQGHGRIWENLIIGGVAVGPGSPHPSYGIQIKQGDPSVVNNLIHGGYNRTSTTGISCGSTNALIAHNTVYAGEGATESTALELLDDGASPILVNNIFFSGAGGVCIRERGTASDPLSCEHNLLFGCSQALYVDEGNSDISDIGFINELNNKDVEDGVCTPESDCEHSRFGYNITTADPPAELFVDLDGFDENINTLGDNNWRLATGDTAITGGGKGTFGGNCGSMETPASCGEVGMDLDGAWRTTPVTPGAYERD